MNIARLYEILAETTVQLRKGPMVTETKLPGVDVVEVFAMPHQSQAANDGLEKVDLHFIMIGVRRAVAEKHKSELRSILIDYPQPERLASGPSYIEVGGVIGDQGAAFQLFALGKVLGLWDVITPQVLGFDGVLAEVMAGQGYIMISGYRPADEAARDRDCNLAGRP